MDDTTISDAIQDLVGERRRIREREAQGTGQEVNPARLAEIQVLLTAGWDLVRRRALREAAGDPGRHQPARCGHGPALPATGRPRPPGA